MIDKLLRYLANSDYHEAAPTIVAPLMDLAFTYPQLVLPSQRTCIWDRLYVPAVAGAYTTACRLVPGWDKKDLDYLRQMLPRETLSYDAIDDTDQRDYGSLEPACICVSHAGSGTIANNKYGYKRLTAKGFSPGFAIQHSDDCYAVITRLDAARTLWDTIAAAEVPPEQLLQYAYHMGVDLCILKEAQYRQSVHQAEDQDPKGYGGERLIPAPIKAETPEEVPMQQPYKFQWARGYTAEIIKQGGVRDNIINAEMIQARLIGGLLIPLLDRNSEIMGVTEPCRSSIVSWVLVVGHTGAGKSPILQAVSPVRDAVQEHTDCYTLFKKYHAGVARFNKARKAGELRIVVDESFGLRPPARFFADTSMSGTIENMTAQLYWRKPRDRDLKKIILEHGVMPNYGFALFVAEAAGLFASLSQFNQSKGYGLSKLLPMWSNCEGGISLRKQDKSTLSEPNASLNIIGCLQDVAFASIELADAVGNGGLGLSARFTLMPVYNVGSKSEDVEMPMPIVVKPDYVAAIAAQAQTIKRWKPHCSIAMKSQIKTWLSDCAAAGEIKDKVLKYHENLLRSALAFECCEMLNRAAVGAVPILLDEQGYGIVGDLALEQALALMKLNHETHLKLTADGKENAIAMEVNRATRGHTVQQRVAEAIDWVDWKHEALDNHVNSILMMIPRATLDTVIRELPSGIDRAAKAVGEYNWLLGRLQSLLDAYREREGAIID